MGELSGEDYNLFGLGGAWCFASGEGRGDIMSGGAVAFGKTMTSGAEGRLSGRWQGNIIMLLSPCSILI